MCYIFYSKETTTEKSRNFLQFIQGCQEPRDFFNHIKSRLASLAMRKKGGVEPRLLSLAFIPFGVYSVSARSLACLPGDEVTGDCSLLNWPLWSFCKSRYVVD